MPTTSSLAFASPCFPGFEVWIERILQGYSSTRTYRLTLSSRISDGTHDMARFRASIRTSGYNALEREAILGKPVNTKAPWGCAMTRVRCSLALPLVVLL